MCGYGIQHTCIFYLYMCKNRVLASFQTRPEGGEGGRKQQYENYGMSEKSIFVDC